MKLACFGMPAAETPGAQKSTSLRKARGAYPPPLREAELRVWRVPPPRLFYLVW